MVNPESVRDFFVEAGTSVLGVEHLCFLSAQDIYEFSKFELEDIYSMIEELRIYTTVLAYDYGFDFDDEQPKKNKKQYAEYQTDLFMLNKLNAYLDYLKLDPEEKLMIRFLAEKEHNLSTFRDAKLGISRFYEKAIPIFPAEVLSFLFEHDDDFNKKTTLHCSREYGRATFNNDGLFISPLMISRILGSWSEYGLLSGKKKLLDKFFETFENEKMSTEQILSFDKSSLTETVGACFNILANQKILDLSEEQMNRVRKINLDAIKQVLIKHLHSEPCKFYVVPQYMNEIRWNEDDGNVIFKAYNEPYFVYESLPRELRDKFANDYIDILNLAKNQNRFSPVDVVENILCQNERLKKIDPIFSDKMADTMVANLKKLDIQKDIFEDVQNEGTLNLKKALKSFIETTSKKEKILELLDDSQRKSFGKIQMKNKERLEAKINETSSERGEE